MNTSPRLVLALATALVALPAFAHTASAQSETTPASTTASATPLTWNDLVRRPETRPATCTVQRDFRFQSGVEVKKGTVVNTVEFNPGQFAVGTTDGAITFVLKPDETDVLAVANAAWAQLTPAQRELTYPALLQRTELWPYTVALTQPFEFTNRKTQVGDKALLLGREGNELLVSLVGGDFTFNVQPHETDLMERAREALASESGQPGRLVEELADRLVSPIDGTPSAIDVNSHPKYVVLYRGANWCGPCHAFSPKLMKVIHDKGIAAPDVLLVFVSADRSPEEAKTYATKVGFDWPTIFYRSRDQLPAFNGLLGSAIPQLIVTDRHGKVVIDSARIGQDRALEQLQKLL